MLGLLHAWHGNAKHTGLVFGLPSHSAQWDRQNCFWHNIVSGAAILRCHYPADMRRRNQCDARLIACMARQCQAHWIGVRATLTFCAMGQAKLLLAQYCEWSCDLALPLSR